MFLFSVSSFIDLLNSIACFFVSRHLFKSYQKSQGNLIKNFSLFYFIFGIFFLFLGLPFFIPFNPNLIQLSFVIAHLFLYSAISVFLYIVLSLFGFRRMAYVSGVIVFLVGVAVFIFSVMEGGAARIFEASIFLFKVISWSHGGPELVRLLIGAGGVLLGMVSGLIFFFYSTARVENAVVREKGTLLGTGLFLLGAASLLAFVLSVFPFYNFWIVLAAELTTIFGLLIIYKAVLK